MATSAGTVGSGNDGQTDKGRGSSMRFSFTKAGRKTAVVGGGPATIPNSESVADNIRKASSDPRLAG